jgi:hypothetical protein
LRRAASLVRQLLARGYKVEFSRLNTRTQLALELGRARDRPLSLGEL